MSSVSYVKNEYSDIFASLIGKTFIKYKMDPIEYAPVSLWIVGVYVDDKAYKLTASQQEIDRFFSNEEVALFDFKEASDSEIVSRLDGIDFIEVPVKEKIESIKMVVDKESVKHAGDIREINTVKAIIFSLSGGNEVSFELTEWFSEMITVSRGYELIQKVQSTDEFLEEWEDCDDYVPVVSREIIKFE